jgi:zinc/manganese transport system substrate-binding protein
MGKLLSAAPAAGRQVIVVADLVHRQPGDNPHLWYDPATMPAYAQALATDLAAADPPHRDAYAARLRAFRESLRPIDAKVAALRAKYAGLNVTATEPVFGDMARAIGLAMRNERFQVAVMNETEPAASDVAAFEDDLTQHRVKLLIYNSQASDPAAVRLLHLAQRAGVPVIGVTETEPAGKTYQRWMLDQLDALDRALAKPGS